jgi:hypothetical protein
LDNIKSWRNWRYAADTAMKPHVVAVLSSFIILIFHRHTVTIRRCRFGSYRRRNRHRKRWQSQCQKEYRKEEIAEHEFHYHRCHSRESGNPWSNIATKRAGFEC